jgi:hypothetical protein
MAASLPPISNMKTAAWEGEDRTEATMMFFLKKI